MRVVLVAFGLTTVITTGQAIAEQSWNTIENLSSASLAVSGADLVGSSIGQTERGEVIMTHWRIADDKMDKDEMAGAYFRCFEIKRYQDKIDVAYCQRVQ